MLKENVFNCVKKHGQIIDWQIAKELNLSTQEVGVLIGQLKESNKLYTCDIITFENGEEMKGLLCRVSGYAPPGAPGRKAKPQQK